MLAAAAPDAELCVGVPEEGANVADEIVSDGIVSIAELLTTGGNDDSDGMATVVNRGFSVPVVAVA